MKSSFLSQLGCAAIVALFSASHSFAAPAQEPLLAKSVAVRPNIALIFDTSGSMDWNCVYAKHVSSALLTEKGANADIEGFHIDCLDSADIRQISPINNLLYYNPLKTYGPGYAGGVLQAKATINNNSVIDLYLPKAGQAAVIPTLTTSNAIRQTSRYDRYEVNTARFRWNGVNATVNPVTHGGARKDCAADPCTFAEERQNIANWRAFHRDRMLAAKTGLSGAFATQPDTFRLAYTNIYGTPNTMKDFGAAKADFFTWLDARQPSEGNGTPLRAALKRAGDYYSSTANSGPWGTKPWSPPSGETAASHLSCRRSYTLMITDGFYNDGLSGVQAAPTVGNVDGTTGTKYTHASDSNKTYQYKPGDKNDIRNRGKSDTTSGSGGVSDTLADIALKYWVTDLHSVAPNNSGTGGPSDPPFWQNMTSYMISFGAPGAMTDAQVASAKLGNLAWTTPTLNRISTIDDMRHAAHNGGGDFLTVTNADQFVTDLGNVIGSISGQEFSQAGVAASAVTLTAGTKKFVPYYTSGTWWGNVEMVNLTAGGGEAGVAWQVISTDTNGAPTGVTTLPTPAARKIAVWVDGTKQAVDFNLVNITAAANNLRGTNANMQMSNAVNADVVDFLRGVRSKEGTTFRKRPAILGDIVNSTPAFIKNNTNPEYEKLPAGTTGLADYAGYMAGKASRTEGVLLVGANDGMLHAFGEGVGSTVGGRELFAYIPRSVLGKLESLTSTGYSFAHTYTVDGPITETDAYVTTPNLTSGGSSTGWRNIAVGTTGAGAKAVFALNMSSPLGLNNKAVLWEINPDPAFPAMAGNSTTAFAELGHVLSAPQSGITASGQWVTIFGNGYDSKSGRASLFIVETGTGKLLKEISTDTATANGLGGVRLVLNANKQIIGAYAGDLKGRVWKFDLSSATSTGWALGNGGAALFTATAGAVALPITAAPAVLERTDQPSYAPSYLVSVVTGKLFDAGDPAVTTPNQAAYGLWDRKPFGSTGTDSILETELEGLTASLVTAGIDPVTGQTLNAGGITSFYTVAYTNPAVTSINWTSRRGWKLTLDVFAGQRGIYPLSMQGSIVKIDTIAPKAAPSSCQESSSNALSFYISPLTGVCRAGGTLDTNGDGNIDSSDANVCAYTSLADGMDVVLVILDPTGKDTGTVDVQNSVGHIKVRTGDGDEDKCLKPAYAGTYECKCGNVDYAAAHVEECTAPDCMSESYRASHPGACPGSTLNRSWRQLFPRAN
jgi:type IV pilus assembly protein PilY1